jgi:hypothetical protein
MRKNVFFIVMCLTLNSCFSNSHNDVVIKANSDTVSIGTRYIAELYVSYQPPVSPSFFIIKDRDTIQLPFDTNKKCAIYRAVGGKPGEKICNGYVEYVTLKGDRKKETFSIKFYVK